MTLVHHNQLTKSFLIGLIVIILFILFEYILTLYIDLPLALLVRHFNDTWPKVFNFFHQITDAGKSVWYLWPCALASLFCSFLCRGKDVSHVYRRLFTYVGARCLFLFMTIALSGIIADLIKPIMGRARPVLYWRDGIYGFSFFNHTQSIWESMPSGHSTTVFALATSLALLYPRLRMVWYTYAGMIAVSRVMVDAHYISDVLAGSLLGSLTAFVVYRYGINQINNFIFPIDNTSHKE